MNIILNTLGNKKKFKLKKIIIYNIFFVFQKNNSDTFCQAQS